jgi:XrtJ-associated TM-motif-TM protein
MHKKITPILLIAASFFALATKSAFALIGGCVASPEDPTVVMALLGGGAAVIPLVWSRVRARRRQK